MTYHLQLLLHHDTDNLSIGQCWDTLHNSHLHHKYNRHYWIHHCKCHFQPTLHNHNLKIGAKYILFNVIWVVEFQRRWILKSRISGLKSTHTKDVLYFVNTMDYSLSRNAKIMLSKSKDFFFI
jgi:hypothetical protein